MKRTIIRKRNASKNIPCDICHNENYLVEHHIRGRKISNYNHPSNICNVCPDCHYKIHKGDIIVEQWLQTTHGKELIWHHNGEVSITGYDATVHLF